MMSLSKELHFQWQQLEKRRDELLNKIPLNPKVASQELVEEWMTVVHQRHTIFQQLKKEENRLKINLLMLKISRLLDVLLKYDLGEVRQDLRELISTLHYELLHFTQGIYQNGHAIEETIPNGIASICKGTENINKYNGLTIDLVKTNEENIQSQELDQMDSSSSYENDCFEEALSNGQNYILEIQKKLSKLFSGDIPDIENLALSENELPSKAPQLSTILECSAEISSEIYSTSTDNSSCECRNNEAESFDNACKNKNSESMGISTIDSDNHNNQTFIKEDTNIQNWVSECQDVNDAVLVQNTNGVPETPKVTVTTVPITPTIKEMNQNESANQSSDTINESKILQLSTVSLSPTRMYLNCSFDLDISDVYTPSSRSSTSTPSRPNAPDLYLNLELTACDSKKTPDTNIKCLLKSSSEKEGLKYSSEKLEATNGKAVEDCSKELHSLNSKFKCSACISKASDLCLRMPDILHSSPQITRRIRSPKSVSCSALDSVRNHVEQNKHIKSENCIYKNKSTSNLTSFEMQDGKTLPNKSSKIHSPKMLQKLDNSELCKASTKVRSKSLSDLNKEKKLEAESCQRNELGNIKRVLFSASSSSGDSEKSSAHQSLDKTLELNSSQSIPTKYPKHSKSKIPKLMSGSVYRTVRSTTL